MFWKSGPCIVQVSGGIAEASEYGSGHTTTLNLPADYLYDPTAVVLPVYAGIWRCYLGQVVYSHNYTKPTCWLPVWPHWCCPTYICRYLEVLLKRVSLGGLFTQLHKTYLLTTCMTPLVSSYLYMQVSGGVAEASEYGPGGLFTQLQGIRDSNQWRW